MHLHTPYFTLLTKPNRSNVMFELPMKDIKLGLKYRVSIKSFPDYKHLLQENYNTWNISIFFSKFNSRSFFFYNTSVHFNMCSFCCTENVYSTTNFSPRVLQNVFSYCSKSVCYSCLQICNIWNWCRKHFVLNIPP